MMSMRGRDVVATSALNRVLDWFSASRPGRWDLSPGARPDALPAQLLHHAVRAMAGAARSARFPPPGERKCAAGLFLPCPVVKRLAHAVDGRGTESTVTWRGCSESKARPSLARHGGGEEQRLPRFRQVPEITRSTSRMNPMSSMRSASSSTKISWIEVHVALADQIVSRPVVATSTSPLASTARWGTWLTPRRSPRA